MRILETQSSTDQTILAPMRAEDIKKSLVTLGLDNINSIEVYSSLTSTNDCLLQRKYIEKSEISVCIAEEQTQGRGRFGHPWWSPKGVNLYLSMLWPLRQWHQQYEVLGLLLLTQIAEMLVQLNFTDIKLKWPNDICINEKKLGGILIERKLFRSVHNLIIGVGLNVAMSMVMDNCKENTWVDLISINSGWNISRNELAARVISTIANTMSNFENNLHENLPSVWTRNWTCCWCGRCWTGLFGCRLGRYVWNRTRYR